jgi:hypothetical protein
MKHWSLILACLMFTACTTVHDLGGGKYAVTQVSEERSPFGTNAGHTRLASCGKREKDANWDNPFASKWAYDVDCTALTEWTPMNSQGQGGQVVSGALIGIGAGVAGALIGASSASSSSVSSTTTAITNTTRGGGGGIGGGIGGGQGHR